MQHNHGTASNFWNLLAIQREFIFFCFRFTNRRKFEGAFVTVSNWWCIQILRTTIKIRHTELALLTTQLSNEFWHICWHPNWLYASRKLVLNVSSAPLQQSNSE